MATFNKTRQLRRGPARTTGAVTATFEGGPAWSRDAKSDLFLLAVTTMMGEDTFYEGARERDQRFGQLAGQVAGQDPDWTRRFIGWLRAEAGMRSASVVAATEAVRARLAAGLAGGNRQLIDAACQRADEPGELISYWISRYGRALPQPVKRGLADAATRLYSERSLLKHDSEASAFRFGDVIDLVHPAARAPWQGELFTHALDRRHGRDKPVPHVLGTLRARGALMAVPPGQRRAVLGETGAVTRLADAGITWEALAGWLQGPMDAQAWEAAAPSMGIFALIRNLRNFDQAGMSDEAAQQVAARISDPEVIAQSRLFPYRFWSAYRAAPSLRWAQPLERALEHSVSALPQLPGRTLVLVDTSGSMQRPVSARSGVRHVDIGALTGVALARRGCAVDLAGFADRVFTHRMDRGGSMLTAIGAFTSRIGEVGHGTRIIESLRASYRRHDQVIIVSDMQTFAPWAGGHATVSSAVPASVPVFGINTTGYAPAALNTAEPGRYEIGGFSDKVFTMLSLLTSRQPAWPF